MKKTRIATTEGPGGHVFDFTRSRQEVGPDRFFEFMRQYEAHSKSGKLCTYIYRTGEPRIDRALAGVEANYVDVLPGPVSLDYIRATHGAGIFYVLFNDDERPKQNNQNNVAYCTFEIRDPTLKPKYNPAELMIEATENRKYIDQWLAEGWVIEEFEQIGKKGERITRQRLVRAEDSKARKQADLAAATPAPAPAAAAPMGQSMSELAQLITALRPKSDPLEQAFQIAERLKPPAPPDPNAYFANVLALVKQLHPPAPPAATHATNGDASSRPLSESIKDAIETAKLLGMSRGGPGGSSRGWIDTASDLINNLPGLVQGAANLLQSWAVFKHGAELAKHMPAAPPLPTVTTNRGGQVANLDRDLLARVGKAAFQSFLAGQSGDDFADQMHQQPGGEADYDYIFSLGKERLLALVTEAGLLAVVPEEKKPALMQWYDDFFDYGVPPAETADDAVGDDAAGGGAL